MTEVSETRETAVPDFDVLEEVYAFESGQVFTTQHGMMGVPRYVTTSLRCIIAELGYEVGDEAPLYLNGVANSGAMVVNKTNIDIKFADLPKICNASTGVPASITAANWNLVIRCEL